MKFSILIPTRNGAKYLLHALETVLCQQYDDCEVIVSVNHSSDNSLDLLSKIADPRLTVLVPPQPLSMATHYEWLLTHAKGQWVTILGDDDGLMPNFFEKVDILLSKWPKVSAISCKSAHYFWEGYYEDPSAKILDYESRPEEKMCHSKWILLQILAGKKPWGFLPKLYTNGIIHKDVIKNIISKSQGKFFHELTPDVYSTIAIAATLPYFLRVETPLFWTGSSPKSVGYSFSKKVTNKPSSYADEFMQMSTNDLLSVANCVLTEMWMQGISQIYSYSALRSLPFPLRGFQNKAINYLVFGSLFKQIQCSDKPLKQIYQNQIKLLKLSPLLLSLSAFLLQVINFMTKPIERFDYLFNQRKHKKNRVHLKSNNYKNVPNLKEASRFIIESSN